MRDIWQSSNIVDGPIYPTFPTTIHRVIPVVAWLTAMADIKKQSLKGITVAYNNSFRIIHNLSPRCSASHMFATNYVKSFNERIRSSIFSLLCRLEKSDNILFMNYLHTFIYYRSPLIKHWIDQLYAFNS